MTDQNTSIPQASTPANPTLADLINLLKKEIAMETNCHHVATVQSFDAAKQTATATVNYKTSVSVIGDRGVYVQKLVDYPVLVDCPVIFLFGSKGGFTNPVAEGDPCIVLFNDRDIDNWFQGAIPGAVASPRLHSFADGFIVVGPRSLAQSIADFDPDRPTLRNFSGTTGVSVGEDKVEVFNADHTLNELLQELVEDVKTLAGHLNELTGTCPPGGGPLIIPPTYFTNITQDITALADTAVKIGELLE